jgi:hypothetical protein
LNVPSGIFHVHLLLSLAFEFLLPLALLVRLLVLLLDLLLDERLHLGDLLAIALPPLFDILDLLLQRVEALVLRAVLLIRLLLQHLRLELHELADALAHEVLRVELVLQEADALLQRLLLLVVDALDAGELAAEFALAVLHVELFFGLGLVDLLLEGDDLLVVLVGLLGVLVLGALEVVVEPLDLLVELLLLVAEAVELALLAQRVLDVLTELAIGEVS